MGVTSTASAIKPGHVGYFAAEVPPAGWLKANGAAVSRAAYAALYLAIGTSYGAGDGSTTFNLPDLRGEFIRGWDDARGVDSGRVIASGQSQSVEALGAQLSSDWRRGSPVTIPSWNGVDTLSAGGVADSSAKTTGVAVSSVGTGATRPRNVALLACVKY